MNQAVAGGNPALVGEVTVMTVWPSISVYGLGRFLGRLYEIPWGVYVLRVGNLIALATAPLAAIMVLLRAAPGIGIRYRLTSRRVLVERSITGREEKSVDLDRFDALEIEVRPGQAWYHAGDLIFRLGKVETFRLPAVSRPHSLRQTIWNSRMAYVGVKRALELEAAGA